MAKGYANPKSPNTATPVKGAALSGKRSKNPRLAGSESRSDKRVNTRSSDNTSNLSVQNQKR
jgi:hypothetical protein